MGSWTEYDSQTGECYLGVKPHSTYRTMRKLVFLGVCRVAFASWDQIRQALSMEYANETAARAGANFKPGLFQQRAIGSAYPELNGYGCWCYFETIKGHGPAQDEFDELCKNLQHGYQCAEFDGCIDPIHTDYLGIGGGFLTTDIQAACARNNDAGTCSTKVCILETEFQKQVLLQWLDGNTWENKFMHKHGFVVSEYCAELNNLKNSIPLNPASAQAQHIVDMYEISQHDVCCGEYPNRYPFSHEGGARGCCNGITYQTVSHKCCSDGSVKIFC